MENWIPIFNFLIFWTFGPGPGIFLFFLDLLLFLFKSKDFSSNQKISFRIHRISIKIKGFPLETNVLRGGRGEAEKQTASQAARQTDRQSQPAT